MNPDPKTPESSSAHGFHWKAFSGAGAVVRASTTPLPDLLQQRIALGLEKGPAAAAASPSGKPTVSDKQ